MLSMKRRTSWPASRKYSAIVSPERPTRRRAPGGSFIWPKTSATFSNTPDSCISSQRSLPSRLRSPTPANTETPPCCVATLLISSWISTVLPRPAPEAVGRVHRHGAHPVVPQVLLHLGDQVDRRAPVALRNGDPKRRIDLRQLVGKEGVDDHALDLDQLADVLVRH